jgi:hypothetical protein
VRAHFALTTDVLAGLMDDEDPASGRVPAAGFFLTGCHFDGDAA